MVINYYKMVKVLCFGSFDVLHLGHKYYLREAKKLGDYLIVVIARDKTIKKIKGKDSKYSQVERIEHVKKVDCVDEVVLGNEVDLDPYEIIEKINPDIIALGYDQNSYSENLAEILKKRGMNPKIVRLKPYKKHIYKSSKLKK